MDTRSINIYGLPVLIGDESSRDEMMVYLIRSVQPSIQVRVNPSSFRVLAPCISHAPEIITARYLNSHME